MQYFHHISLKYTKWFYIIYIGRDILKVDTSFLWYNKIKRCHTFRFSWFCGSTDKSITGRIVICFCIGFNTKFYSILTLNLNMLYVKIIVLPHKNTKRHTANTIVSWPDPKQWVIVHTFDLMMIISQSIYIISIITRKWVSWKHTAPRIV